MDHRRFVARQALGARARSRKLLVVGLSVALGATLAGVTAPSANAAPSGGAWSSSFEQSDDAPEANTPYGTPHNVTPTPPDLMANVVGIDSGDRNTGNSSEDTPSIADGNASTKWFVPRSGSTSDPIVATYTMASPQKALSYRMTNGNDSPFRDPQDWTVSGSNDGSSWTVVDTESGVDWGEERNISKSYDIASPAAYTYYRLEVTATADSSRNQFQLADWYLLGGSDGAGDGSGLAAAVVGGPRDGTTAKANVGFTGTQSYLYAGKVEADGPASATAVVYDALGVPIGATTQLSYKIFPESTGSALDYTATYAAVDLELSDGTTTSLMSSDTSLTDGYGFPVSAAGQGEAKALVAGQWNSVTIDLGSLAGETVTKVLVSFDDPSATAGSEFQGWVDDVAIGDADPITGNDLTQYVDTRRGSNANGSYSRGNTFPGVTVPNGFNFITPMTNVGSNTIYEYQKGNDDQNRPVLQGIGFTHMPSPWMGDSDRLSLMTSTDSGSPEAGFSARGVSFSHDNEVAHPDYYSVTLDDGVQIEATPTDHASVFRFTFPAGTDDRSVILDRANDGSGQLTVSGTGEVTGWVDSGNHNGSTRMFVYGQFDQTPQAVGTPQNGNGATYARFDPSGSATVELQLATSFISQDQAQHNLQLEVGSKDFDAVHQAANAEWNDVLGVISVGGATQNQKVSLYSSLYRLNMYPNSGFENTGTAASPHYEYASPVSPTTGSATATETNAKIVTGKIYVNNGFWDTYRTVWPLYSFLYPDRAEELVDGFVQQYRDGGWISRWSSPGYADEMTGTSSDVAFADAYVNGVLPTDLALEAYDAALKNATVVSNQSRTGRKGLDSSIFLGYTPSSQHESVSWSLEGTINDDGIAQMAAKLAADPNTPDARRAELRDEAAYFTERSKEYVNLFNPAVDFFTEREADGSFTQTPSNFDPTTWWGPYTETDAWNFAFHAPFDVKGLAGLYGGSAGLIDKLEQFYATPEHGGGVHEMAEARDVRLGQLGISNQVSHHIPYIAAAAGDPALTQKVVREVLQRLFVGSDIGQGYLGDEDNGEMSSWYIFSSLGLYPLALASGQYTIGSPQFDQVTIHRADGDLTITANDNSTKNVYVQSVSLDGKAVTTPTVPISALKGGSTLTFQMGDQPSSWGTSTFGSAAPVLDTDLTQGSSSTVSASDGTNVAGLTDDTSSTTVTFGSATPTIDVTSSAGRVTLSRYTLTDGGSGSVDPTAWTLQGSNDGQTWTDLDSRSGETFRWRKQTRPFSVADAGAYDHYRLKITATTGGAPTLSELELDATSTPPSGEKLTVTPGVHLTGTVGQPVEPVLATVSGGTSYDYDVTVDLGDGSGPATASLGAPSLGGRSVTLSHTFTKTGVYPVTITARQGSSTARTTTTLTITRDGTLAGSFDSDCIAVVGVGANCDGLGSGYDAASLAKPENGGFVQGKTLTVPGTDLSYDLPAARADGADNVTAQGQKVRIYPGQGATQISFIGTANEHAIQETATITYADGSTQQVPIEYGDWVGTSGAGGYSGPSFGNIRVGLSDGRLTGASGKDDKPAAIFATAPVTLTGTAPQWLTMPEVTGSLSDGQIHLFAIASDGDRSGVTPLAAHGSTAAPTDAVEGSTLSAELATVSGGDSATAHVTATVNWGDGSVLDDATVHGTTVTGTHRYAKAGSYTATVTVDDGVTSATTTRTIVVVRKSSPGPVPTRVSLSRPVFSAKKQVSHAVKKRRVSVSTRVSGTVTGTVTFREGSVALGSAPVKGGKASLLLPAKLSLGKHHVTAFVAATATTTAATSPASSVVKVVKAKLKKLKVKAKKHFKAHHKVKIKVKVSKKLTNGHKAKGKITIKVGKKTVAKIGLKKLRKHHGKVVIKKRFVKGKKLKVKATFKPKHKSYVKKAKAKLTLKRKH